jgi:hypothetical protein
VRETVEDEYERALSEFDRSLEIDSSHVRALCAKALVLAACPIAKYRDGGRARELASKACVLTHWRDHYAIGILAASNAECQDFDDALRVARKALDLAPEAGGFRDRYCEMLETFKRGEPYRTSGGDAKNPKAEDGRPSRPLKKS